jgi:hypothetical protein
MTTTKLFNEYANLRHQFDVVMNELNEVKRTQPTILKSKVNGELYKLEFTSREPSGRVEVRHIESGKLFRWEHLSTFEVVKI